MKEIKLRDVSELVTEATQLKAALQSRSMNILQMVNRKAQSDAGTTRKLNPEVEETLVRDTKQMVSVQSQQALVYATLRWSLGLTETIDHQNLELDEK